jgi:hypothetical protein
MLHQAYRVRLRDIQVLGSTHLNRTHRKREISLE